MAANKPYLRMRKWKTSFRVAGQDIYRAFYELIGAAHMGMNSGKFVFKTLIKNDCSKSVNGRVG